MEQMLQLIRAFGFDVDPAQSQRFAERDAGIGMEIEPVEEVGAAARHSEARVACTPSRQLFLRREDIAPAAFIAAMGADRWEKQEFGSALLPGGTLVVDRLERCEKAGELHHAIEAGLLTRPDVHAELGAIAAGKKMGRVSREEITIFGSTGTALQDVAAAAVVYRKGLAQNVGTFFDFRG